MKQYIITIKPGIDSALFAQKLEREGVFLDNDYQALPRHFLVSMDEKLSNVWAKDSEIISIENADKRIVLNSISKPITSDQKGHNGNWGLSRIAKRQWSKYSWFPINDTWTCSRTGFGVDVYVVDSGCNLSHKDFGGRVSVLYDAYKPSTHPLYGIDATGHGTNVASIIGGYKYGVASGVFLYIAKVFDTDDGSLASVVNGMNACLAHHLGKGDDRPSIINLSLGGGLVGQTEQQAINDMIAAGMVCVMAAGNGANDITTSQLMNPITVGATAIGDDLCWFSNYGTAIDVFAPGQYISSAGATDNTCEIMLSGTSQASPFVAGICSLYLEGHRKLKTADEVLEIHNWVRDNSTPGVVALSPEAIQARTRTNMVFAEFVT